MPQESRARSKGGGISRSASDAAVLLVTGATVIVLIVLAVVLVNREDAARTAENARIAILAEGSLSAAASVENASSQTLLAVTVATTSETVDDDVVIAAVGALTQTVAELQRRFDVFAPELTESERITATDAVRALEGASRTVASTSLDSDLDATTAAVASASAAYNEVVVVVAGIRDDYVQSVLLTGRSFGRVADAVRFLIFFLVPLMMVIAYRRGARRREKAQRLEEALVNERALAQSRDDFIADLSHELRTPLTGIYGFALALGDSPTMSDEDHELARLIISDAAELNRMVDDLITTGRIAAGTLAMSTEDLRLEPLVNEVADVFGMRGIPVRVRVADVTIRADRAGLRQLVLNLVSNAARHGGDEIAVEAIMREGVVSIRVIDDGPGVPEDIEPYLFNRYLHGDGRALLSGSVGLGTAVAAAYAESFGGSIEYHRTNDRTVFEVRLPAVIPESEPALA